MGFGGSSLGYCAPPFPAPLPAAASAAAATTTTTSSSSSSTLSPLAPPFTVDRAAPRPALPYDPFTSSWPPSSDDCLRRCAPSPSPPSPPSPPRPAVADALPYYAHGRSPAAPDLARAFSGEAGSRRNPNPARADPYYPLFSSTAATSVGDAAPVGFYRGRPEGSVSGSGYVGRRAAVSSVAFGAGVQAEGVGGSSSWVERENVPVSPGYGVTFQQDASISPGFFAYEDLHGGWHGKLTESASGKDHFQYEHLDWLDVGNNAGVPPDFSGASTLAPSASVGMCYPHSSDMHTFVEGSKTSDFNFSCDRYICQANTDRTDPRVFYPATTCFPAKMRSSSSSTSTSMDKCSLKNVNHVQHVNAFKNDMLHRLRVSVRPKEPSIDLNFEHKEDYAGMNREEGMKKIDNANVNFSLVKITSPPSIESAKQISLDCSLGKISELRIANLNIPGSVECDHEQISSERSDENLAEDSPCWKGAPSARRSGTSTFDTLVADLAFADQKFDGPYKRASDYSKGENEDAPLCSSGLKTDKNIVMPSKDHRDDFESRNENVVQAANEQKGSTLAKNELISGIASHCTDTTQVDSSSFRAMANDQLSLASTAATDASNRRIRPPVFSDPSFRGSALGIDAQVLVQTIHNLSELLLSSCHSDANLLKEHEKELLWSAVVNLHVCVSRKLEPGPSGRTISDLLCRSGSYPHRQLFPLSEDALNSESIDGSVEQINNGSICPEQKLHSITSNVCGDKLGNFLSTCGDGNLKKDVQLSGKVMNEKICEQEENPQTALNGSLWLDVDDAVRLLKYRLQLLRLNIMTDNCQQQLIKDTECEASNMLKLSSKNYKNSVTGESTLPLKSTGGPSKNPSAQGKHENVTNVQMAQRTISSTSVSKLDDVDASVMARFKVLKRRIDNLNGVDAVEQHGWLKSLNDVSDFGTHENICSPCPSDGKRSSGLEFQHSNDAMSAGWGHRHLFHSGGTEGEDSGRSSGRHPVADYTEGQYLNAYFSQHTMSEGFCGQGAGGLTNQSYVPDSRSGKHFVTGVHHDGSSDWEHVLAEELTW